MNKLRVPRPRTKLVRIGAFFFATCMLLAEDVFAQSGSSPWLNEAQVLQTAFTGKFATGLALVAIVVGGLMFAFGEGCAKRTMARIIFGVGMAIGAVNFMAWLFPSTYHGAESNQSRVPLAQSPAHHPLGREKIVLLCPRDGSRCFQSPQNAIRWRSHVSLALCPRRLRHQRRSAHVRFRVELMPDANAMRPDVVDTCHGIEAHGCSDWNTSTIRTTKRAHSTSRSTFSGSLIRCS